MSETVTIALDPQVMEFYKKIALTAGVSPEALISHALMKLAGELSLEALKPEDRQRIYDRFGR